MTTIHPPTYRRRHRLALLVLVPVLVSQIGLGAVAADPIELSILSYNTHGLPAWIARDQPARRFPRIAKLAAAYDVAVFQENFVDSDFHLLADGLPGRFLARGNGSDGAVSGLLSTFCGSCGSGLTAAVTSTFDTQLLDRKSYGSCAGWIGGANDCWASKGYLAVRITLANGASFDIYDLHLDAGAAKADHKVRQAQLEVLRGAIRRLSHDRAVVVAGDFNLNAHNPRDSATLGSFCDDLHLTRSEAGGRSAHWTEQLDYILYRSGGATQLTIAGAGEATELVTDDNTPLSDHPAVFARFAATPR